MHKFQVHHGHDEPKIETAVFQAIGYGSTCWTNLEGAGIFQSSAARDAGTEAIAEIRRILHTKLTLLFDNSGLAHEWNEAIEQAIRVVEGAR